MRRKNLITDIVRAYRAGAHDPNSQPPERHIAQGSGIPCRHCLQEVTPSEAYLLLAHRPFASVQPYAEFGPIFLPDPTVGSQNTFKLENRCS